LANDRVESDVSAYRSPETRRIASATPEDGFRLDGDDGRVVEARPDAGGWVVTGAAGDEEWFLRELSTGYRLEERRTADTLGEISRLETAASTPGLISLLLGDGRLFTISPRVEDPPGYDLAGWEVPGAYWTARLEQSGWLLSPTPAGAMLADDEALVVLFVAQLLLAL
jgi:hypothetical protein